MYSTIAPPADTALPATGHPPLAAGARLSADSRQIRPGDVFIACQGEYADGRDYIVAAIAKGAAFVYWDDDGRFKWKPEWRVPNQGVADLRRRAGILAASAYGNLSGSLKVFGVTGTNGKTSVSQWLAQAVDMLENRPRACAIVGTVGNGYWGSLNDSTHTTPDPVSLQTLLHGFAAEGAAAAIEVSSHGLDQYRVNGTPFSSAVFTNLTRDHLDYHGSMQAYGAAKVGLFSWPTLQAAVVNLGDPLATEIIEVLHRHPAAPRIIGYWVNNAHGAPQAGQADAAFQAMDDDARARLRRFYELAMRCDEVLELALDRDSGQHVLMMFPGSVVKTLLQLPEAGAGPVASTGDEGVVHARQKRLQAMFRNVATLRLNVLGRFNMENALAAAGAWRSLGWNFPAIVEGLHQLHPVPGRMEIVGLPAAQVSGADEAAPAAAISSTACPLVVVDYAHTPDALTNVLTALRDIAEQRGGQLCCVFGAGGNRDRGKRPEMARAVEAVADRVVVTSDNPRGEDPAQIIADVCQGLSHPAWRTEADRRVAIDTAIAQAAPTDVVLIAGKGRETTQEIAGVFHPFSDPEIAAQALASHWALKTREVPHA